MVTNEEKREIYAQLKTRLKRALAGGFWLEACMIEYAILEDRTSSILYHAGVSQNAWASDKKLYGKLNSIEHQIGKKHPLIAKKVAPETVQAVRLWKDRRNDAVHRACFTAYDEEDFRALATEGKALADRLSNDSRKVKRAAERRAAR